MELDKRIEKINDYFVEMKVVSDVNNIKNMFVSCSFPQNWIVRDIVDERFNGTQVTEQNGLAYFWIEIEKNTENLFNAIDSVIQKNMENEAKMQLLREKTSQLENLFFDENNSLEKLKTLQIVFNNTPVIIKEPTTSVTTNDTPDTTVSNKGRKPKKEC